MRVLRSRLRGLLRRPATWLTFGILTGLLVLILVGVTATGDQADSPQEQAARQALLTFPLAYELLLSFVIGLGGLFAVTYGAAVAGSEWTWGTLKASVARGESRSRYLLMTFAAVSAFLLVGLLFSFAVGVGTAVAGATVSGISTDGLGDSSTLTRLPELVGRGWFAMAEEGAIGFAVATVAGSQLAGIGIGIALYFGEAFASIFLHDIVRYLPFNAAASAVGIEGRGFGAGPNPLPQETAMLLVAAWLIGSLLVAALYSERADITG